jgi:hypothetical protein
VAFHIELVKRVVVVVVLRTQKFRPEYLLPVLELLAMAWMSSASFWRVFWLWNLTHAWASWWFVATSVSPIIFSVIAASVYMKHEFFAIRHKIQSYHTN